MAAAQLASGTDTATLYERQLADPSGERAASTGPLVLARWALAMVRSRTEQGTRAAIGRMALRTRTVPESERREVIASRLLSSEWPEVDLRITAVRADTGEFRVFDAGSGVSVVDAVAASCAMPGVWPPITVDGARYVDGGVRSVANVDLAATCDPVVVLAPITTGVGKLAGVPEQAAALESSGARVLVVAPDEAARTAIGRNVLDPARRAGAARAGYAQAQTVVADVLALWG